MFVGELVRPIVSAPLIPEWQRRQRGARWLVDEAIGVWDDQGMAITDHDRVSANEFLGWSLTQQERFELVNGVVIKMMAGARQSHNVVTLNVAAALLPQVKRSGCRATSSDTAVRTSAYGVRYPDVVVDCGKADPSAIEAAKPTMVVEVSSPGTLLNDETTKLDEYRAHTDIRLIMLVEPDVVSVKVYRRTSDREWTAEIFDDLSSEVELSEIGATLSLSEIYDTLEPQSRTRIRRVEDEPESGFSR